MEIVVPALQSELAASVPRCRRLAPESQRALPWASKSAAADDAKIVLGERVLLRVGHVLRSQLDQVAQAMQLVLVVHVKDCGAAVVCALQRSFNPTLAIVKDEVVDCSHKTVEAILELLVRGGDGLDLLHRCLEAFHDAGDEGLAVLFVFPVDIEGGLQLLDPPLQELVLSFKFADVRLVRGGPLAAAIVAGSRTLALGREEAFFALAARTWRHGLRAVATASFWPHRLSQRRAGIVGASICLAI